MRLAQRQIRSFMANNSHGASGNVARRRPRESRTSSAGNAPDGQDRHCDPKTRLREPLEMFEAILIAQEKFPRQQLSTRSLNLRGATYWSSSQPRGRSAASDIYENFDVSAPAISQHLKVSARSRYWCRWKKERSNTSTI